MSSISTKLPDMFYVKAEFKTAFLSLVEIHLPPHHGEMLWEKYPIFLKYRKCDYSNQDFLPTDLVYCVYVTKILDETFFTNLAQPKGVN